MKRKFNIGDFVKITGRFKSNITGVQDTIKEGVEVDFTNPNSFNGICGFIIDYRNSNSSYQVNTGSKDGIYLGWYSAKEITKITEEEYNEYYNPKPVEKVSKFELVTEDTISLPEEYIVECSKPSDDVLIHYYGESNAANQHWKYLICSKRINFGKFEHTGSISRTRDREDCQDDIHSELKSLPIIKYEEWLKLKDNKTKQENKMNKRTFRIGGILALRKAFVEEVGAEVYSDETLTAYKYLTSSEKRTNTLQGCIGNSRYDKYFELPKDWNEAVAYAKEYFKEEDFKGGDWVTVVKECPGYNGKLGCSYKIIKISGTSLYFEENNSIDCHLVKVRKSTPEEIEAASTKTLNFGKVTFTVKKGDDYATTPFGKVTREEIRDAIEYIKNPPKLATYPLSIHVGSNYNNIGDENNNFKLGFGCKTGTLAELEAILKAFD